MALNPAYLQQTTRTLPFALGYVYGTGDNVSNMVGFDGTTVAQYVLGEGEWDGPHRFSPASDWPFLLISPAAAQLVRIPPILRAYAGGGVADYLHFHGGSYGAKGVPLNVVSVGPDQGSDTFMQYYPSVTPVLNFSGLAYYIVRAAPSEAKVSNIPIGTLNPIGIWRSTRCRIFDDAGNVVSYAFTVNPTWQMIETILRFQVKPQQPPLAGLTNAEKRLFDWPAMFYHATRNAITVPSGAPRFCGNFMFAADMSLGQMMETQLRNCRSYKRERAGVISFVGDDARASVFTFSQRHIAGGTVKLNKKDLSTAPNVFVPQFRDINIPAIAQVVTADCVGSESTNFTTTTNQPFFSQDYFAYSGSADDADFAGDYRVGIYLQDNGVNAPETPTAPPIPNQFNADGGPATAMSTTGGYLGTEQSRFKQRAPNVVMHRAAQTSFAQVAPGLTLFPRQIPAQYDLGNNTFDQTNRLMQFRMITDLGPDVTPYVAPRKGSFTAYAEGIDANRNCVGEIEPGDVITLDDKASPEFAGDYVVQDPIGDNPPSNSGGANSNSATRELAIQTYQPTAFTDVSYAPGNSYQTLPNLALPTADVPVANAFYLMQATPTGGLQNDGTLTIGLPDLSIWWVGQPAATAYTGVSLSEIPFNAHIILYLTVTSFGGAVPVLSVDTTSTYPPVPLPFGKLVIYIGSISTASVGTGSGGPRPIRYVTGGGGAGLTSTPVVVYGAVPVGAPPAPTTSTTTSPGTGTYAGSSGSDDGDGGETGGSSN